MKFGMTELENNIKIVIKTMAEFNPDTGCRITSCPFCKVAISQKKLQMIGEFPHNTDCPVFIAQNIVKE